MLVISEWRNNSVVARLVQSPVLIWILLAIPSIQFINEFLYPSGYYPEMMQRSGLLSVQLLVFVLCITPITLLLKPFEHCRAISRWLLAKRKYFGLASASYAAIHTILYLRQISWDMELAWLEGLDWPFATGWISMFAFLVVAAVSNRWGVSRLGKWWKTVQRLTYVAAIAALIHWLLLDFFIHDVINYIAILLAAKTLHVLLRALQFSAKRKSELAG